MMVNPCEIEETGVDCQHIYGNHNRIEELQKNGLFVKNGNIAIEVGVESLGLVKLVVSYRIILYGKIW